MKKAFLYFTLAYCSLGACLAQSNTSKTTLDSILYYRTQSKQNQQYSIEKRLAFGEHAKRLALEFGVDSTLINTNRRLSTLYWESQNDTLFKAVNRQNIILSESSKDTSSLAKANYNLGYLHSRNAQSDSAFYYYSATEKLYHKTKDYFNRARTLNNIAIIQKNEKDFVGSEQTSIEALKALDHLKESDAVIQYKSMLYNNLGAVYYQLEETVQSITYYETALRYKKQLKGNTQSTIDNTKNNLALAYQNDKQYHKASEIFKSILNTHLLEKNRPDFYALVLSNYAYVSFLLGDQSQLPELYLKALRISDTTNTYNTIIIQQHLAEYYHSINQNDSAKYYAYNAKGVAEEFHNDDLLKSLRLLSEIEDDSLATQHYNAYINLSDSLVKAERTVRNKFMRIQYETDKIKTENQQISKERTLLLFLLLASILTATLIYIVITQRAKNKTLKLQQEQQKANEYIYNLMLNQQHKIDQAKVLEKKRISQELHDGILGRIFGTRLSLESLNANSSKDAIQSRYNYIEQLKVIEHDIRKVSHDLNTDFVENYSFLSLIESLVEEQSKAYNLKCKFTHNGDIDFNSLPNKTKIHLYRIVQESLQNIYKHAKATEVTIDFQQKNNDICLRITDNGIGFNSAKTKKGIGLKNINNRVATINGTVTITSEKNKGTQIIVTVPN